MTPVILRGDCVTHLQSMPEASVDAIVCDPPYGLEFMGKEWDKLGGDRRQRGDASYKQGDARRGLVRHGGTASYGVDPSQAGLAMQESHAAWAAEAFRVLKPGGHLLAFGGSRTFHRLACAIEDVGFEIRDSIAWMYGQGFPKSLDVSKAIDKAAGAERAVVGVHTTGRRATPKNDIRGGQFASATEEHIDLSAITAPATDDARTWDGWGTALKPGMEPIVVARKPLAARTVAANVVKHGTGALNIDGCRIGLDGGTSRGADGSNAGKPRNVLHGGNFGVIALNAGRWPANVVLSHVPDDFDADGNEVFGCRALGTATEAQPVWECAPGCPVAALDAQSGVTKSQGGRAVDQFRDCNPVYGGGRGLEEARDPGFGDEGGASRFFYQSKATNRERWGYCHDCSVVFNRGDKIARGTHKPHRVEYHPTVKPVDLMRWLVRLVTPPGGLVVDPFCGTGTTGEAACLEGFRFIGMEREPTYARIAAHRLNDLEIP